MQFPSSFCHSILGSNYFPHHSVLIRFQPAFLTLCVEPSFNLLRNSQRSVAYSSQLLPASCRSICASEVDIPSETAGDLSYCRNYEAYNAKILVALVCAEGNTLSALHRR
jgi:hypothetical protein